MKCKNIELGVERIRKIVGANKIAVASFAGVSTSTYTSWENNQSHPDIEQLFLLATYFGCKMEDLIRWEPGIGEKK